MDLHSNPGHSTGQKAATLGPPKHGGRKSFGTSNTQHIRHFIKAEAQQRQRKAISPAHLSLPARKSVAACQISGSSSCHLLLSSEGAAAFHHCSLTEKSLFLWIWSSIFKWALYFEPAFTGCNNCHLLKLRTCTALLVSIPATQSPNPRSPILALWTDNIKSSWLKQQ